MYRYKCPHIAVSPLLIPKKGLQWIPHETQHMRFVSICNEFILCIHRQSCVKRFGMSVADLSLRSTEKTAMTLWQWWRAEASEEGNEEEAGEDTGGGGWLGGGGVGRPAIGTDEPKTIAAHRSKSEGENRKREALRGNWLK